MINAISAADIAFHVKFNVCLVTKPLGVFSSETKWLNAWLLLRVEYTADVQQQKTKGQKNEKNNEDNRFV